MESSHHPQRAQRPLRDRTQRLCRSQERSAIRYPSNLPIPSSNIKNLSNKGSRNKQSPSNPSTQRSRPRHHRPKHLPHPLGIRRHRRIPPRHLRPLANPLLPFLAQQVPHAVLAALPDFRPGESHLSIYRSITRRVVVPASQPAVCSTCILAHLTNIESGPVLRPTRLVRLLPPGKKPHLRARPLRRRDLARHGRGRRAFEKVWRPVVGRGQVHVCGLGVCAVVLAVSGDYGGGV